MLTLDDIIRKLRANRHRLGIELNPPAPEADIRQLEQALGRPLPPDIAAFYRFCNGFETNDDIFRVPPIADVLSISKDTLPTGLFVLAEYMICSDLWEIKMDSVDGAAYEVVNDNHGTDVAVPLTSSAYEFIGHYLDGENLYDLYDWYEEEKQNMTSSGSV